MGNTSNITADTMKPYSDTLLRFLSEDDPDTADGTFPKSGRKEPLKNLESDWTNFPFKADQLGFYYHFSHVAPAFLLVQRRDT